MMWQVKTAIEGKIIFESESYSDAFAFMMIHKIEYDDPDGLYLDYKVILF